MPVASAGEGAPTEMLLAQASLESRRALLVPLETAGRMVRLAHWAEVCLEGFNWASLVLVQMAQTEETAQETIGFLDQTLYRWDRLCVEAPASRQLARELHMELCTRLAQARGPSSALWAQVRGARDAAMGFDGTSALCEE